MPGEIPTPEGAIGSSASNSAPGALPEYITRQPFSAEQRFAPQATIYKDDSPFGEVTLRREAGPDIEMTPVDLATFVQACMDYALVDMEIAALRRKQEKPEKTIREMIESYKGLRGAEFSKLDRTVTGVPEVSLSPTPKLRPQAGTAFPNIATEQLEVTIIIPEGLSTRWGSPVSVEVLQEYVGLGLNYIGMDDEVQKRNVKWKRGITVKEKDKQAIYELVKKGLVDPSVLGASEKISIKVAPIPKEKPQRGRRTRKAPDQTS
jgi:hypothetical protein